MPSANDSLDDPSQPSHAANGLGLSEPRLLRLVMVGAGALGSAVAAELAKKPNSSVAKAVLVVDPDLLESRNVALSRTYQEIFAQMGAAALNRFKADLLVGAMTNRAATTRWTAVAMEIADLGWVELADADLILSCTDSALARVETAFAACTLGIPMLDGGVLSQGPQREVTQGRVTWFSARQRSACYLCGLTEARRSELLRFAGANSLGCHPPDLAPAMGRYAEVPAVLELTAQSLAEFVRSFAAFPEASLFAGYSWAMRVHAHEEISNLKHHQLTLARDCPWHGRREDALLPLSPDVSFRDVLRQHVSIPEAWRLEFSWPVCLRARCRSCGISQPAARRLAALRRRARCAHCGAVAALESLHTVVSVGVCDPEAERTPRELGMPERHLYRLRPVFHPRLVSRSSR